LKERDRIISHDYNEDYAVWPFLLFCPADVAPIRLYSDTQESNITAQLVLWVSFFSLLYDHNVASYQPKVGPT
jgi:hypothetical protein